MVSQVAQLERGLIRPLAPAALTVRQITRQLEVTHQLEAPFCRGLNGHVQSHLVKRVLIERCALRLVHCEV